MVKEVVNTARNQSVPVLRQKAIRYFVSCVIGIVSIHSVDSRSIPVGMQPVIGIVFPLALFACYLSGLYFLIRTKNVDVHKSLTSMIVVLVSVSLWVFMGSTDLRYVITFLVLPLVIFACPIVLAFLPSRAEVKLDSEAAIKTVIHRQEGHSGTNQ